MIPLVIIAGPTASGKTSLAVELAKQLDAEIVGADSMQVYEGFDIGTATPSEGELRGIPHHMLSFVDPRRDYDAAAFARDADRIIEEIHARGKRVIVAGGTGLYIRVLLHGLQAGPPPDPKVREEISTKAKELGWPAVHRELEAVDPKAAERLHPNDGVRILRALEVARSSHKTISQWQEEHRFSKERYPHLYLCLQLERSALYERINIRADEMMGRGFLEETRALLERGFSAQLKPMQGLGYKRLVQHLRGELSLDEAVEKLKTDTRRLAKRQLNWFRTEKSARQTNPNDGEITNYINDFLFNPRH